MAYPPKTPTRHRSRSETKTPLSSSIFGTNKLADASNPFIVASRPASPVKRSTGGSIQVSQTLQRQASAGIIRKGGIESRLDVVTRDYVPPPPKSEKRSRSQPSRDNRDRFITTRDPADEVAATLDLMSLNPESASPGHTARLAAAAGVPLNRRILAYHEPPPVASSDPLMAQARELVRPLYARAGSAPSGSSGTTGGKDRRISTYPYKILDAPGMQDDFYLNLISWSSTNVVGIALGGSAYIWKAETGDVVLMSEGPEGSYIASLDFSNDGQFLGVGYPNGAVELWDVETQSKLRTMSGHAAQVGVLAWNNHILSSGSQDGSIWHHDVRVARHKVMELLGHQGEVCGLRWRADGELLASGGNDNVLNIWDGRLGDVGTPGSSSRSAARWTKRNHTAAVKAVAWCPWQPALLASGGGTSDATVHIWNTTTGARLHSLVTPAQISSIQWSPHRKEFLTTHGYPTNAIMVHSYPSMDKVAEIKDAHDSRVLFSALSPNGELVCTAAGDENLKFWKIWEAPKVKKKEVKESRGLGSTNSGILSIRHSDPEMARLTSPPIANPQTRPVSETSIAEIPIQPLPQSQSVADLLVPIAPLSPLELPVPFPSPCHPNTVSFQVAHRHADPPAQGLPTEALAAVPVPPPKPSPRQKREKQGHDADVRITTLTAALKAERIAREVAEEACAEYTLKVTALQDEVIQLRRTLFSSVTSPSDQQTQSPSFATTLDSIMDASAAGQDSLAVAENITLVVERDRLRRFIELMVSVGGHKPVLQSAYQRVTGQGEGSGGGEDAETALVAAIKDAVRQPGSVWRGLLEPVTGARTQDEYLAQVRCTLDARKQTMDWRKRTKFWKGKAKEEGRNGDTVTPSASALSAVADAIPAERRKEVREVLRRRGSTAPHVVDVALPKGDLDDALSPTASRFALDMVAHWNADSIGAALELTLPATSSSMVLPAIGTRPTSRSAEKPPSASSSRPGSQCTISGSSSQTSRKFRRWDVGVRSSTESARSSGSGSSTQEAVQASTLSDGSTAVASPLADFSPLPILKDSVSFGEGLDHDLILVMHNKLSDTPHRALASTADAESERGSDSGTSSGASSPKKSRLPVRMRGLRVIKRLSTTFSISRGGMAEMVQADAKADRGESPVKDDGHMESRRAPALTRWG
ncbi:hypothetical protein LXA43DRAFT_1075004 [Ganoderma leucocontextum]|nr:hypothetical protein LXA43DRAFT_1075004 [Ganoderma leucocontextum]